MRILGVSGSLNPRSSNAALVDRARALAPPGVELAVFDGLRDLPHFDPDLQATPPVEAWRAALASSDAVLIASPEYGHSLPGALKNAIDWVIGTGELERKVVAITASVNFEERGRRGLSALAGTLRAVSATVVGGDPLVRGPDFEARLEGLVNELARVAAREAERRVKDLDDSSSEATTNASVVEIRCRCGSVEIAVTEPPIVQLYCHCDDCQAAHGACYVPESVYRAGAVRVIRGAPGAWKLKRNPRITCRDCGTRLFIDVLGLGLRGVNGTLLPEGTFRASFHMNCKFAVRPVKDDLPHYALRPAQFGGSDETVDW